MDMQYSLKDTAMFVNSSYMLADNIIRILEVLN